MECESENISSGGMAVQCSFELAHGEVVEVAFTLPDSDISIEAKAKLAWTSPGGLIGLSFSEIHPAIERQLQEWLLERAREEGCVPRQNNP
jgi:c-di-GMP-binding flagellar brake protein YcgR